MRIYVGNLTYDITGDDLRKEFEAFGKVESAQVITDRDTGRSKGFGFVEMPSLAEGQTAIAELNGKNLNGRNITVNPARERTGGGGGGYAGGRGGGGFDRDRRR